MSWKFWEKKVGSEATANAKEEKLPGPKEMPSIVGRHLVVTLGNDPDWVWKLKTVMRHRPEGKQAYDIRVYSDNEAMLKKVSVKNYNSLEDNGDLILFEGWFDKKSMEVHGDPKTRSPAA